MCWDISLHTDIEIIKKTFPQLRDERRQLDYNYDYAYIIRSSSKTVAGLTPFNRR